MLLEVKAKVVKLTGIAITEAEEREKMLPSDVLLYSMFRTVSVYLNRKQVEYLYSCVIMSYIHLLTGFFLQEGYSPTKYLAL